VYLNVRDSERFVGVLCWQMFAPSIAPGAPSARCVEQRLAASKALESTKGASKKQSRRRNFKHRRPIFIAHFQR
jgi:hypothetical protein